MPRIKLKSKHYARQDFEAWVRQVMHDSKLTNEAMGAMLGYTGQRFGQKLREMQFEYPELVVLFDRLECPPEKIVYFMTGTITREVKYGKD